MFSTEKTAKPEILPAHPDFDAVFFPEFPSKAEVDDPEVVVVPFLAEDDVERLQVEVKPTVRMNKLAAIVVKLFSPSSWPNKLESLSLGSLSSLV